MAFAREGASVVIADVSEGENQEASRKIEDVKAALNKGSKRSGDSTLPSTTQVLNSQ